MFSRGNNRERVFTDATDFRVFLDCVGNACERTGCEVHAYCVMPNHYHLLLETTSGELPTMMRHVNGRYAGWFNKRHGRTGHVFGSRFTSELIEDDDYFLTVVRYLALNPVSGEAPLCDRPEAWRWSSYPLALGRAPRPVWLDCDKLLARFGRDEATARIRLREFVEASLSQTMPTVTTR